MLRDHRTSAAALLRTLDPPTWHLRHSCAVAEIAGRLAARAEARGFGVDRARVESAALLHDVDKLLPAGDPAHDLPHGEGSAAWLDRQGLGELGSLVSAHPVTRLADDDRAEAWITDGSLESWLVAYADKRAGQRLESMATRFESWQRRYPDGWDAATMARVRERAERLERAVCALLDVAPGEVRRLPWTRAALRRAAGRERLAGGTGRRRPSAGDAGSTGAAA